VHDFLFCKEFNSNTSRAKELSIVACVGSLFNAIKSSLKVLLSKQSFAPIATRHNQTALFGNSCFNQINGTTGFHTIWAVHFTLFSTMRLSVVSLQMYGTFLCEQPIYAKKQYAINQTIFFMCEWLWFGILESYAIKWFMRLSSIQLAQVVCTNCYCKGWVHVCKTWMNSYCSTVNVKESCLPTL